MIPINWDWYYNFFWIAIPFFFDLVIILLQKEEEEEWHICRLQAKDKDWNCDTRSGGSESLSAREGGDGWDGFVGSGLVPLKGMIWVFTLFLCFYWNHTFFWWWKWWKMKVMKIQNQSSDFDASNQPSAAEYQNLSPDMPSLNEESVAKVSHWRMSYIQ